MSGDAWFEVAAVCVWIICATVIAYCTFKIRKLIKRMEER